VAATIETTTITEKADITEIATTIETTHTTEIIHITRTTHTTDNTTEAESNTDVINTLVEINTHVDSSILGEKSATRFVRVHNKKEPSSRCELNKNSIKSDWPFATIPSTMILA